MGAASASQLPSGLPEQNLPARFLAARAASERLATGLSDADATVQSMPDASPAKWHLAHTSWFFETLILEPHAPDFQPFDPRFGYLFNSYYETLGPRHDRPRRGMLTRPTLAEVLDYRRHVTAAVLALVESRPSREMAALVELGCQHEQQHQELLLTDILHLFASNPLEPACFSAPSPVATGEPPEPGFIDMPGGIVEIGHDGPGFAFDCEGPRHRRLLEPYRIANWPVTNRAWIAFIADGGYAEPRWWLSEGWAARQETGWEAPLYWELRDGIWTTMSLHGRRPVMPEAPVCHISFYEADAYARWAGLRLPTEFEWECAFADAPVRGNFADSRLFAPHGALAGAAASPTKAYGDVWEWTASAFSPYPRFRPAAGAVGEYNGKFMSGQYVLRGGSCATPAGHVRPGYRNFFPPHARWQFSGLRLAADC
ncbi:MAG: ergothioneine biosynthesis protein EgtB [Sphingomonadales bacterium]|nr:ergothioneine biosynthesis protein EgtB [Sphingomonadales bacterium]MBU3993129.1 ergothioneine biosynthesis protein EgtB [Alphaproteobacteria bacterium]